MLLALALLGFCFAAALFALIAGGAAERIGAAIILTNLLTATANYRYFGNSLVDLGIDGLTAAALLVVALRYASFWLGAVMLVYAFQFALHAYYLVLELPHDRLHVLLNNSNSVAISLCLAAGTLIAWRRRVQVTRGMAPAA